SQPLALRAIHPDGTFTRLDALRSGGQEISVSAGDVVDEEYVIHYAGDGGIPEHNEAFQFFFGSFNQQVLSSLFVALTPATDADRGVVIVTGQTPRMTSHVHDGMLARVWQKETPSHVFGPNAAVSSAMAIVRVVEEENGWVEASSAEHQRRIETIHRGPRLQDSARRIPTGDRSARLSRQL